MNAEIEKFLRKIDQGTSEIDNHAIVPHGERPCPICGSRMIVENEFGIITDVCTDHGVWLDTGELATLIKRIRARDRASKHKEVRKAKSDGILAGEIWGIWAYLFDE